MTDIVWPEILRGCAQLEVEAVDAEEPTRRVVVLEAAVMFEAGWDRLPWTRCGVRRGGARDGGRRGLPSRDGVDAAAIEARIDAQLTNDERIARSDLVFDNSGSEAELIAQVDKAWDSLGA